jgi:hypothetical protein
MVRKIGDTNATSQLNAFIRRATRNHTIEDTARKIAAKVKTFHSRNNPNRKMPHRKYKQQ